MRKTSITYYEVMITMMLNPLEASTKKGHYTVIRYAVGLPRALRAFLRGISELKKP